MEGITIVIAELVIVLSKLVGSHVVLLDISIISVVELSCLESLTSLAIENMRPV